MFVYNARCEDWIQENDVSVFANFRIRPSTRICIRIGLKKIHSGECFQTFPDTAGKYTGYVWTQAVFIKKIGVFTNLQILVDIALALLRDTLDHIDRTMETAILVSLDREKAFDRVNRSFLMTLLEHYGFGPAFCNCICMLYNGAYMPILVNNFLSNPVPLQ